MACVVSTWRGISRWDEPFIVEHIFDVMKVRPIEYPYSAPFIVPDESACYMADVRSVWWCRLSDVDPVAMAARQERNYTFFGNVRFTRNSILERRVDISNWPKQVAGNENILFLCGGAT
jgi:hypothetical protein